MGPEIVIVISIVLLLVMVGVDIYVMNNQLKRKKQDLTAELRNAHQEEVASSLAQASEKGKSIELEAKDRSLRIMQEAESETPSP